MELPELYKSVSDRLVRGGDGIVREIGVYTELFPAYQRGEMKIQSSDVFVVSYPKSGTVWMTNIVGRILSHGDEDTYNNLMGESNITDMLLGMTVKEKMQRLNSPSSHARRLIMSHSMPEVLPPVIFQGKFRPKVIYVMRNPKDVVVSDYHFHRSSRLLQQVAREMTFSQFLPYYINNDLIMGGWFEHVSKWWKHKEDENILFIKYEDVLKDRKKHVCRIAEFLDINLTDREVDIITEATGFQATRKYVDDKLDAVINRLSGENTKPEDLTPDPNVSHFIRKGKVGDWKNHFTVAESEAFDQLYNDNMAELSGLHFEFE